MRSTVGAVAIRRELLELCSQGRLVAAYARLRGSGLAVAEHPGLWELLERRAEEAGDEAIARRIRRELLAAEVAGTDTVLNEARHEIRHGQMGRARAYLEHAFGASPEDSEARILLGIAVASEKRSDALTLLDGAETGTETEMLWAVDALRGIGELRRALHLCKLGLERFPQNTMFQNRLGWIAEGMRDYATARSSASVQLDGDGEQRAQALNRLVRINRRLGDREETLSHAADLLRMDAGVLQKLRLARSLGQTRLLEALVAELPALFATGHLEAAEAEKIVTFLLDEGHVGLALLLWRAGLPIATGQRRMLERHGFGPGGEKGFPTHFEDALAIRSPDILFPLAPRQAMSPLPIGVTAALDDTSPILLVNSVLAAGGAERQFVMVARSLVAAGIAPGRLHAALFSMESDRGHDHFEAALRKTGIHVHDLSRLDQSAMDMPDAAQDIVALLPARLRGDVIALHHLVKHVRPAVIHGWQDRAAVASGLVGAMLSVPRLVLSVRNMRPKKRGEDLDQIAHSVYRELLGRPSVLMTANAGEGARDYEDWLGLPEGAVAVLSNAVDEVVFTPGPAQKSSDGPLRILGVFRLTENKRPLLWLETVAALQDGHGLEIAPHIVGAGPMAEAVRKRAGQLGLDHLRLEPPVADPSGIYRQNDMLLLMSRVEGTPNVVLEAQACGLPVAACRVGGVADALHAGGAGGGLLLDAETSAADAARRMADWLPRALSAPRDGRVAFIRSNYSMSALAVALKGLYGAPA